MSILVNAGTRILVQGITGREGQFHTRQCLAYGSQVVAGVTPGKGGQEMDGVVVFNTVAAAVRATSANLSLIFVPPPFAADAILEAADAEVPLIIAITEGIPVHDMLRVKGAMKGGPSRLIGPNCPGVITPGQCKAGIMPGAIHLAGGPIGVVSRSGTLTYEVVHQLSGQGIGQTTCLGIGGDPVSGTSFIDALAAFQADPETRGVVLVGEIGGSAEEEAARFIREQMDKPVVAFIAGRTAPPGRRMGHAGAITSGTAGTAQGKMDTLRRHGVQVAEELAGLGKFCAEVFAGCQTGKRCA
jgi:succinyl-CoA synthetase alpha subunit